MVNFKKAVLALVIGLALPSIASADIFYPSGSSSGNNRIDDLDHQHYYTWVISGLAPIGQNADIVSASVTFRNLYNWDNEENILHLDLLDTARIDGSYELSDNGSAGQALVGYRTRVNRGSDSASNPDEPTKAELTADALDVDSSTLVSSGTARTNLDDRSFVGPGGSPTGTTSNNSALQTLYWNMTHLNGADFTQAELGTNTSGPDSELFSLASWSVGNCYAGAGCDYTYNFSASERSTLETFINNGGNIALGFDPDCHFWNDGVSFAFETSSVAAVPEPASLVLLGTGLATLARRYRRRKASTGTSSIQ